MNPTLREHDLAHPATVRRHWHCQNCQAEGHVDFDQKVTPFVVVQQIAAAHETARNVARCRGRRIVIESTGRGIQR